jgi:hypothetical protein
LFVSSLQATNEDNDRRGVGQFSGGKWVTFQMESTIVMPRGVNDFRLPTDLLDLTPATFEPNRQDKNLIAALGPACNRIRKAMENLGILGERLKTTSSQVESTVSVYKVSLQAWNGQYICAEGGGGWW